jgi:hypothetical protein
LPPKMGTEWVFGERGIVPDICTVLLHNG